MKEKLSLYQLIYIPADTYGHEHNRNQNIEITDTNNQNKVFLHGLGTLSGTVLGGDPGAVSEHAGGITYPTWPGVCGPKEKSVGNLA